MSPTGSVARQPSTCANHAERIAHALCMACRKLVCHECATEWQGINYCLPCLAQRRQAEAAGSSFFSYLALLLVAAGSFWIGVRLLVWAGVLLTQAA